MHTGQYNNIYGFFLKLSKKKLINKIKINSLSLNDIVNWSSK